MDDHLTKEIVANVERSVAEMDRARDRANHWARMSIFLSAMNVGSMLLWWVLIVFSRTSSMPFEIALAFCLIAAAILGGCVATILINRKL